MEGLEAQIQRLQDDLEDAMIQLEVYTAKAQMYDNIAQNSDNLVRTINMYFSNSLVQ